jgi:hypothetical protein
MGAHQLFLAYSAWNTDIADTISSHSDWKANQKRAEKKAKTTTQPPMPEGDMVTVFEPAMVVPHAKQERQRWQNGAETRPSGSSAEMFRCHIE